LRRYVLVCLCIVAIAWITRLTAAPGSEPVEYHFKIDSQPLATALQQFAEQSGVQVIFFSQVTEGLRAPALHGSYTLSGALEILLSGSHLIFRVINPKTIEIYLPAAKNSGIFSVRPSSAPRMAMDLGRRPRVC
jgi:iron complex outermembrane recepter protein